VSTLAGLTVLYLVCWLAQVDIELVLMALWSSTQSLPRVRLRMNGANKIMWSSKWVYKL
jgi:hypothetical protein